MNRFGGYALAAGICILAAPCAQATMEAQRGKAVIVGRVVDKHGKPMPGVPVFAQTDLLSVLPESFIKAHTTQSHDKHGPGDIFTINGYIPEEYTRLQRAHAITDADGRYRLTGITTARYQIMLDYKEKQPREWTAIAIQNVPAKENETVTAPDLILTHGALVTGTVRDEKTHKPLAGATVEYMGPSNPNTTGPFSAVDTRSDGTYSLRLAPGGSTVFVAMFTGDGPPGRSGYWVSVDRAKPIFHPGLAETSAVKVNVHDGETHTISFSLAGGK